MSSFQKVVELSSQAVKSSDLAVNQAIAMGHEAVQGSGDHFIFGFTVFILACFVGYFVVWKVTPALHTPLMAVTNAISSVIVVGAIIALGSAQSFSLVSVISFIAIVIASVNIFGGFFVTWRMLQMFKK